MPVPSPSSHWVWRRPAGAAGDYTFVEVAFAPRLAAEAGRPIDLSPQPSARIELCGDLRPSGA